MFITCKICGYQCSIRGLSNHIKAKHNITTQTYYCRYLGEKKYCLTCGKVAHFRSIVDGYGNYCSKKCAYASEERIKKAEETNLKIRGVRNPFQDEKVKKAIVDYWKTNYNVTSPSQLDFVKKKREKTCEEKYGFKYANSSPVVKKKKKRTFLERYGVDNYNKLPEARKHLSEINSKKETILKSKNTVRKKIGVDSYLSVGSPHRDRILKATKEGCLNKLGVSRPFKSKKVQNKIAKIQNENLKNPDYRNSLQRKKEQTSLKHYGVRYPAQHPKVHRKIFANRKRAKSEIYFQKLLKKKGLEFKKEYYIENDTWQHHFDFAIFKNGKLKCLVEIDGEYYHGLINDCDGFHSMGYNDHLRWNLVPNKVKFLVIDSTRIDEGFRELLRILPMKYKDWKKEMLRSISKNIEDAIPKFDKKRMLKDWDKLIKYRFNRYAFIGKSILLNFCKSRIIEALSDEWKSLRKTLYKSPCSSHHLLEGFDIFKNTSKLREKFKKKYKGVKEVIVKHHSPEKMLAICSLGKTYISKEPVDKESKRIIKFLNLKVYEIY